MWLRVFWGAMMVCLDFLGALVGTFGKKIPQRIRPLLVGQIVRVGTHWRNHARLSCGWFNGRLAKCEMGEGMSMPSVGLHARLCLASARCPTGTSTSEGA